MNKLLKKRISKIKYLAIVLISLISIFISVLAKFERDEYLARLEYFENEIINNFEEEYEIVLYSYRQLSNFYYSNIINNSKILEIMKKANNSDENKKNGLREELRNIVNYDYTNAKKADFRQYHFVLKDNTSFLRMHKLDKFGDDLSNIRYTVDYVNKTGEFIEGFEEGRIFNGYRFEYPLYYNDEFVGCVEISMSYESISNMMKKLFNVNCIFLINKEIVDEKVWEEESILNYSKIDFNDDFYIDNKTINNLSEKSIMNIKDKDKILQLMDKNETFNIHSKLNGIDYCNGFLSIKNVQGIPSAYLIFSAHCDTIYDIDQAYISKILLFVFLWILLVVIIVVIVQNRIKIETLTSLDKLTGAYNRNLLYKNIQEEIVIYHKKNEPFSIILIDFDDFKEINDINGHLVGDKVLKDVVKLFNKELKNNGYVFRYGGDEFLIILNSIEREDAKRSAINLIQKVNNAKILEKKTICLSMGLVSYNDTMETPEDLVNRADKCLYKAKSLGKNQVYSDF